MAVAQLCIPGHTRLTAEEGLRGLELTRFRGHPQTCGAGFVVLLLDNLEVRAERADHQAPFLAVPQRDHAARERVNVLMRDKYGLADRFIALTMGDTDREGSLPIPTRSEVSRPGEHMARSALTTPRLAGRSSAEIRNAPTGIQGEVVPRGATKCQYRPANAACACPGTDALPRRQPKPPQETHHGPRTVENRHARTPNRLLDAVVGERSRKS